MLHFIKRNSVISALSSSKTRHLTFNYSRRQTVQANVSLPFAKPKEGSFIQETPHIENTFLGDAVLQRNLKRILPNEVSRTMAMLDLYNLLLKPI